jgi:hypothetical protein
MAVNITTEKYDPLKIELIKKNFETQSEQGAPLFYEIYVDNLKVVHRTNKVELFDNYEEFVNEDTQKIRILIYSTHPTAPRNTKHIFLMKAEENKNGLSGAEIQNQIAEGVARERAKWECDQVRKDLETSKTKLTEAEDYIEKLKKIIYDTEGKLKEAEKTGDFTKILTELAGQFLPLKNQPKGNLSGAKEEKKPEEEASFSKVQESSGLSEEEQRYINAGKVLEEKFTEPELDTVFSIIDALAADKNNIKPVAELLNINHNQKTKTNEKV